MSVSTVLRSCLPEPALLAGSTHAGAGVDFQQCTNAFLKCSHPDRLQELADSLTTRDILHCAQKWLATFTPFFTEKERKQAGCQHRLFFAQVELCDNLIFRRRTYRRKSPPSKRCSGRRYGRNGPGRASRPIAAGDPVSSRESACHWAERWVAPTGAVARGRRRFLECPAGHCGSCRLPSGSQPLWKWVRQTVRPGPPAAPHRAGFQQRPRLSLQQGGRKSPSGTGEHVYSPPAGFGNGGNEGVFRSVPLREVSIGHNEAIPSHILWESFPGPSTNA